MSDENAKLLDKIRKLYEDPRYQGAIDSALKNQDSPSTSNLRNQQISKKWSDKILEEVNKKRRILPVKVTTLEEAVEEAKSFNVTIDVTEE
jgi:hypothetical protein